MSQLKILALVHESCLPPEKASLKQMDWANWKTEYHVKKTLESLGHEVQFVGATDSLEDLQKQIQQVSPDIVFNLLEEFQGEALFDGHIVSMLELMGIPYTGCNPQGLSLGRDKSLTKKILNYHKIKTPQFFVVKKGQKVKVPKVVNFPLIVKSLFEEASLGISQSSIVKNEEKLQERVEFIHRNFGTPALVEEYIEGKELYVGILGNHRPKVFAPWEIYFGGLKKNSFPIATRRVKFNKKYCQKHHIRRGAAKGIDELTLKRMKSLCREAFKGLKLNGYARMDLRLTPDGQIYFLEVNPNPELANGECLANAARQDGLSYEQLIQEILHLGLRWEVAA